MYHNNHKRRSSQGIDSADTGTLIFLPLSQRPASLIFASWNQNLTKRRDENTGSQRDVFGHFLVYLLKTRGRGVMVRCLARGSYVATSWAANKHFLKPMARKHRLIQPPQLRLGMMRRPLQAYQKTVVGESGMSYSKFTLVCEGMCWSVLWTRNIKKHLHVHSYII